MQHNKTVLLYSGRCTMFNMTRVERIKKGTEEGKKKVVSNMWEIEDDFDYLIARLVVTSHPWLVVHHRQNEVVRAPLALFIDDDDDVDGNKIFIILRDSAKRDDNECIKRKFIFVFHTSTDALIFKTAHNLLLRDHSNKVLASTGEEPYKNLDTGKKRKANVCIYEETKRAMKKRFEIGDDNDAQDDENSCTQKAQGEWDGDDLSLLD